MSNYLLYETCLSPKCLYISLSLGFHQILTSEGMKLREEMVMGAGLPHIFNRLSGSWEMPPCGGPSGSGLTRMTLT